MSEIHIRSLTKWYGRSVQALFFLLSLLVLRTGR